MTRIVLWCEQINLHYASWIRALSEEDDFDVMVIASQSLTPERRKLGWRVPQMAPAQVMIANDASAIAKALVRIDTTAIHIVEGIRGTSIARHALKNLIAAGCRIGLISENCDQRGILGIARLWLYRTYVWRLKGKLDFVLAMGTSGVEWYVSCGFPATRVFPFAYTADMSVLPVGFCTPRRADGLFRLLYLGSCVKDKGIRDIFEALSEVNDIKVSLTVIGDGEDRELVEAEVSRNPALRGRVEFKGALPYCNALAAIPQHDLLVLPSHYDGWGVVVNEALMLGVPVVCSNKCGSKDVLARSSRGGVFPAGDVESLARELKSRIQVGRFSNEQRDELIAWSRRLSGGLVAKYFVKILAHVYAGAARPYPPWKT